MPLRIAPFRRHLSRCAGLAVAAIGATVAPASASTVSAPIQPLAIVGESARPECSNPLAPFVLPDIVGVWGQLGGLSDYLGHEALQGELEATIRGVDLTPSVVVCSSAYPGLPGPITGDTAEPMDRSRVGLGWRELGGTLRSPAPLVPGDRLVLPSLDDAAEVRLSLAPKAGDPAVVAKLTDLSPGPITVTIEQRESHLAATLTRGDGSVSTSTVIPVQAPALRPQVTFRGGRLHIQSEHLPGTTVGVIAGGNDTEPVATLVRAGAHRVVRTSLRPPARVRAKSRFSLTLYEANRSAQFVRASSCRLRFDANQHLQRPSCKSYGLADLVRENLREYRPNGGELGYSEDDGFFITALRAVRAHQPRQAARASARRAPERAALTSVAADGLHLVATPLTPATAALAPRSVRPLSADINGDGAPDYWTDVTGGAMDPDPPRGVAVGYVLVSGPAGLSAHRVVAPSLPNTFSANDSEIGAIADITGDGLGELTVDLVERIAIIPGSVSWTSTTDSLSAPDPGALRPSDLLIVPQLSSPGAPLAAMPDVTGDGLRELAVTDDEGAAVSIASSALVRGAPSRVPSAVRPFREPLAIEQTVLMSDGAPQVYPASPATQIIGGHAVSLRWLKTSTLKSPNGRVLLTVRDALGQPVRPAATFLTPGDAHVLDYDPVSGDVLLRAITAGCDTDRYGPRPGCKDSLLRVRAGSVVTQRLSLHYSERLPAAPLATARFLPDGPDPDAAPEVVLSVPPQEIAVIDSAAAGALKLAGLPRLKLPRRARTDPSSDDATRFRSIIAPDGSRRLVSLLPYPGSSVNPGGQAPVELRWR